MVIATTLAEIDRSLILYGLAGSELLAAGRACGLRVASEVFADRTYQPDGSLTPRTQPGALIDDENAAIAQVLRMLREGSVRALDGASVSLRADTICLHGDGPHAAEFARRLRRELERSGVQIVPVAGN